MSSNHWDAERYQSRHAYIWQFGEALIELLAPRPGERIVDLGCGPGHLTAKIAESGAEVIGVDASAKMIAQALENFPSLDFRLGDATDFKISAPVDAVFSNAMLHWVQDQKAAIECIWRALKPGGRLVAEMGGKGNVETIVRAAKAMNPAGVNPWFYPSVAEYAALLEAQGFEVRLAMLFDRPTKIESETGMEDWLVTFGSSLTRDPRALAERLRPEMFRDAAWWIDHRRLRIVAVK
jgi:trans-aconitate methyltransferase